MVNLKIEHLFRPPLLPTAKLIKAKINDVEYVYPDNQSSRTHLNDQRRVSCWDAPLPCSSIPILGDIKLRNPQQGISKGFEHQE